MSPWTVALNEAFAGGALQPTASRLVLVQLEYVTFAA
jgi:hypothetical protein